MFSKQGIILGNSNKSVFYEKHKMFFNFALTRFFILQRLTSCGNLLLFWLNVFSANIFQEIKWRRDSCLSMSFYNWLKDENIDLVAKLDFQPCQMKTCPKLNLSLSESLFSFPPLTFSLDFQLIKINQEKKQIFTTGTHAHQWTSSFVRNCMAQRITKPLTVTLILQAHLTKTKF